jgi:hypothetical protein
MIGIDELRTATWSGEQPFSSASPTSAGRSSRIVYSTTKQQHNGLTRSTHDSMFMDACGSGPADQPK